MTIIEVKTISALLLELLFSTIPDYKSQQMLAPCQGKPSWEKVTSL